MISIRRVQSGEIEELIPIYKSAYRGLKNYAYTRPEEIRGYLNWLFRGDPQGFFVAEKEGNLIGFVSIHGDWWDRQRQACTGEIHELVVHADFKGQGVGKILVEKAFSYLQERRCKTASLWVGENNLLARRWYKKLGFREVGQVSCWVRMVKNLSFNK